MKATVTLESKEVRKIIARFLNVPEEAVVPLRYTFAIEGMSPDEIERRINGAPAMRGDDGG